MALVLPEDFDTAEVTVLKRHVRSVAQKYAERHGWCDVVNKALAEAGITDNSKIHVCVTFRVGGVDLDFTTVQRYSVGDLSGKTDEEQRVWVAEQIQIEQDVMVAGVTMELPVEVISLENASTPGIGDVEVPVGYLPIYTSEEGRVAHLIGEHSVPEYAQESEEAYANWLRNQRMGSDIKALCRAGDYWTRPVVRSPRADTGRVCATCTKRADDALAARG